MEGCTVMHSSARVIAMDVEARPNRYEWLQVLLAVLLGFANVALWLFAWIVLYSPCRSSPSYRSPSVC
jgi:hypothetical protein